MEAIAACSPPDIMAFMAKARRGEALEYHRGVLSVDCDEHFSKLPREDWEKLKDLRKTLWYLYEKLGAATLVQKRHGPSDYSYFVVKC